MSRLFFKTTNSLRKLLSPSLNTPPQQHNRSGIYKLKCNDCNKFYIGKTGRTFITRFKEHTRAITHPNTHSTFAEHIINTNHTYTNIDNNLDILHFKHNSRKLDVLEQFEIYKNTKQQPHNILNDQINFSSHILFDKIITHSNPPPPNNPTPH